MRIFCYFVEPATYTLDLAENIYEKNYIDYCFIRSNTLVVSDKESSKIFLDKQSFISRFKFVWKIFRNNDLVIVNGYNNYPFILTFLFNILSKSKIYIATESDTQLQISNNPFKRFVKWMYLSFVFQSKYVLGFSGGNFTHKDLFRNYGMQEKRIFLMPMMVNNSRFIQENKVFPQVFTFLYVGRIVKCKNVEALIQQFNLHFFDKSAVLRIVGSGTEEEFLRNKYESNKVIFVGKKFNNDLLSEFHNASCFVCPSAFEPWGLVVNEALSSSLPLIATKEVGANFDLIDKKDTGFVSKNMTIFGENMIKLFDKEELLKEYSHNAKELMFNHWNYDLYNKCLNDAIKKVKEWL